MPLTIRPVQNEDHTAWLPLWHAYIAFYKGSVSDAQTALTWQRILDPAHPLQAWVAEQDGVLLGFTHAFIHPSTWSDAGYCYLEDLFVSQTARGQGVARQLIETCAAWAKTQRADQLYWLTQEDNHTARQLYDRVAQRSGFIHYKHAVGSCV
ncbi:MAG: GNAT family N-acetyltransferase [Burkholderiales bacterium]|nr:MAG: GNAT family N-acetyltransferase [Burkholderiales bacterium]